MATTLRKRSAVEASYARSTRSKRLCTLIDDKENGDSLNPSRRLLDVLTPLTPTLLTPIKSIAVESIENGTPKPTFNAEEENLKPIQTVTPRTPRHRDALSKQAPSTPRRRVVVGKSFTPQTPRTPSSTNSFSTIYNTARLLFARSSDPGKLVGRDSEKLELKDFINACIQSGSGGCTYISGPPGTGKSALVNEMVLNIPHKANIKSAYINCMSMKTSKDIYGTLLESLCGDVDVLEGEEIRTLQGMFLPRMKSDTLYLITMDEMDHILSLDLEFMYKLFEWALQKSSKLVLLGIANALDLTDRFLPRLKARNLKPILLPFLPYTTGQIKAIITSRLRTLLPSDTKTPDFVPFLHPIAIDVCARKVSGQTGDLRKALDLVRRAIDLIESETKQKYQEDLALRANEATSPTRRILGENSNITNTPNKLQHSRTLAAALSSLTVETAPRVTPLHMNKASSLLFSNGSTSRLKTLNLQQKAALCSLVSHEKRSKTLASFLSTASKTTKQAPSIKDLYKSYIKLCKTSTLLHPLSATEFRDVIGSLETLSLLQGAGGKAANVIGVSTHCKGIKFNSGIGAADEKRLVSCVSEKELEDVLGGPGGDILRQIISGHGLD